MLLNHACGEFCFALFLSASSSWEVLLKKEAACSSSLWGCAGFGRALDRKGSVEQAERTEASCVGTMGLWRVTCTLHSTQQVLARP